MEVEQAWSETPIEYRDKAYSLFHKMKMNEVKVLAEMVAPENTERFTNVVKYFIKWDEGKIANFTFEFSNNFTKIRKLPSPTPLGESQKK